MSSDTLDPLWRQIQDEKPYEETYSEIASPHAQTVFSDNDISFESVSSLPTPLKQPRFASDEDITRTSQARKVSSAHSSTVLSTKKFVAVGDVPRKGYRGERYNKIRPVKKEEDVGEDPRAWPNLPAANNKRAQGSVKSRSSTVQPNPNTSMMYELTDEDTTDDEKPVVKPMATRRGSTVKPACVKCRAKKTRCIHDAEKQSQSAHQVPRRPITRQKPKIESDIHDETLAKLRVKTEPGENRVKKDGTPYLKKPHNPSNGPSMTKTAVDYRLRKVQQQEYQDRLAELIDQEYVDEVEAEGGITPLGRLFKAAVRMLEDVHKQRAEMAETRESATYGSSQASMAAEKENVATQPADIEQFKAQLDVLLKQLPLRPA